MKALYDKEDMDYYVLLEKGDIEKLLNGEKLNYSLIKRNKGGDFDSCRKDFQIISLDKELSLYRKNLELEELKKTKEIHFSYSDVIVFFALGDNEVETIFLDKEWIKIGLSQELLDRCGKNEQRYGAMGSKVHFYYEDCKHFLARSQKDAFWGYEHIWNHFYDQKINT